MNANVLPRNFTSFLKILSENPPPAKIVSPLCYANIVFSHNDVHGN